MQPLVEIDVPQATDYVLPINMTDGNTPANKLDITGWKFYFTVKGSLNDLDAAALITQDWLPVTSGGLVTTNGQTQLVLTNTQTNIKPNSYYCDLKWKLPNGVILSTPVMKLVIQKTVTIRSN